MKIENKADFQPSTKALEKWLATRKSSTYVAGFTVPQFFSDTDKNDRGWFLGACFGELFGLIITIYGGMKHGGIFLLFATLYIVLFIISDFFFAIKLHRNEARKCKINTLRFLHRDATDAEGKIYDGELRKGIISDYFLVAGIISFIIFKVIAVVLLGVFNNVLLYLPVVFIYSFVAYVHIMHTGYFFAYRATQKQINKEHKEWIHGNHNAIIYNNPFTNHNALNLPATCRPHEIIIDPNPNFENDNQDIQKPKHYLINVKGVLTDEDINYILTNQTVENQITLFRECRRLQVGLYGIVFPIIDFPNRNL